MFTLTKHSLSLIITPKHFTLLQIFNSLKTTFSVGQGLGEFYGVI